MKTITCSLAYRFRRLLTDDDGATLVEYGLLITLIALVCIAVVTTLGTNISGLGYSISGSL